jgi:predicted alpha/beta superfamily hydrolase
MKRALITVALVAVVAGLVYLINPPARGFKIRSEILGEKRTILEFLPEAYESTGKSYPVLLHLDADPRPSTAGPSFYAIAESVNSLGDGVPGMIVLGIPNTDRNRDMLPVRVPELPTSGGAKLFLRFITEELMPNVEARYRASGEWILYGRSDSGLFALYALTETPAAFRAVIASSPSLGRCPAFMIQNVDRLSRSRPGMAAKVFIVYGSEEVDMVAGPVSAFAGAIRRAVSDQLVLGVKSVPGGGHVPKSGLADGLRYVFSAGRTETSLGR